MTTTTTEVQPLQTPEEFDAAMSQVAADAAVQHANAADRHADARDQMVEDLQVIGSVPVSREITATAAEPKLKAVRAEDVPKVAAELRKFPLEISNH